MKKNSTYACQSCGTTYPKWQGQCHGCQEWNGIIEIVVPAKTTHTQHTSPTSSAQPHVLATVTHQDHPRIICTDEELNRVLGGGLVPGSLVLLGGEPGIGKSTLLLQLALSLQGAPVLYASGEESAQQIKMRALRLSLPMDNCYVVHTPHLEQVLHQAAQLKPQLLIIDSIQTLHTETLPATMGSVGQVKACTAALLQYAKTTDTPVLIIGHITKEGTLAGPKVLEHMVDTVLQFEGDRHLTYRILRAIKNRFGPAHELGIYDMQQGGLVGVKNPSALLLSQRDHLPSGIAIGAVLEGTRPLLIEVQALVTPASYGTPQRSATGFDAKRLNMLLAVLEKRAGYRLGNQDVFLNIAGGIRVEDPALDLAICMAIVSSLRDTPLPQGICFAAEVGLGGEVRGVSRITARLGEAEKLGFQSFYCARTHQKYLPEKGAITPQPYSQLTAVMKALCA